MNKKLLNELRNRVSLENESFNRYWIYFLVSLGYIIIGLFVLIKFFNIIGLIVSIVLLIGALIFIYDGVILKRRLEKSNRLLLEIEEASK